MNDKFLREEEQRLIDLLCRAESDQEKRVIGLALEDLYRTFKVSVFDFADNPLARKVAKKPKQEPLTPTQKIDRKNDRRTAILEQRAKRGKKE